VPDLQFDDSYLLDLNIWYRNHAPEKGISTFVFHETRNTKGHRVVTDVSADPGIPKVTPIAVDGDHISLPKFKSRADPNYKLILKFIRKNLAAPKTPRPVIARQPQGFKQQILTEDPIPLSNPESVAGSEKTPRRTAKSSTAIPDFKSVDHRDLVDDDAMRAQHQAWAAAKGRRDEVRRPQEPRRELEEGKILGAAVVPPLHPSVATALANAQLTDPFAVLGSFDSEAGRFIRVFLPGAIGVDVVRRADGGHIDALWPTDPEGLFVGHVLSNAPYRLRIKWPDATQECEDPYNFGLLLSETDLHLFNEGRLFELATTLGANPMTIDGVRGTRFAVWAPNARAVSVIGDFNAWDNRRNPMRLRFPSGVWELFVPRVGLGVRYKFAIVARDGTRLADKADPLAKATEVQPGTASIITDPTPFVWHDEAWMRSRAQWHRTDAPISIYEVHAASWWRSDNSGIPTWPRPICGRPPPRKVFGSVLIRSLASICPACRCVRT
jgi:hypothetical protein